MSGPYLIAAYKEKLRLSGDEKLMDLTVLTAPNDETQFYRVRDALIQMSQRKD